MNDSWSVDAADRALLEAAAKAAKVDVLYCRLGLDGELRPHFELPSGEWWSPLADDGDALRLAVCLGLDLALSNNSPRIGPQAWCPARKDFIAGWGSDRNAATRRAIVLAAAGCLKE